MNSLRKLKVMMGGAVAGAILLLILVSAPAPWTATVGNILIVIILLVGWEPAVSYLTPKVSRLFSKTPNA